MIGKLEGLCRSNSTLRAVTMTVLMISDLDITFSILFAVTVINLEGLWKYGACVHGIGILTYSAGVLWFGPQQKYKVVSRIKDMMMKNPELFKSTVPPKLNTPVSVTDPIGTGRDKTQFQHLQNDEEGVEKMKLGMTHYGIPHVFHFYEIQISRNMVEREHGLPFIRIARFGFSSELPPQDLACILNANTLYTVCTGTWQLVYGAIVISVLGEVKIEVILPLAVSAVSFLLSVANVGLDFSAVLTEIEKEKMIKEKIKAESDTSEEEQKLQAKRRFEEQRSRIEAEFSGIGTDKQDTLKYAKRSEALDNAENRWQLEEAEIDRKAMERLENALNSNRQKMKQLKDIERGKVTKNLRRTRETALVEHEQKMKPLRDSLQKIEENLNQKINELDVGGLSAEEYDKKMQEITAESDTKKRTVEERMRKVNEDFGG